MYTTIYKQEILFTSEHRPHSTMQLTLCCIKKNETYNKNMALSKNEWVVCVYVSL